MKIILKGAETAVTVNDSYGARLIEQGKAKPAPTEKPKKKAAGGAEE